MPPRTVMFSTTFNAIGFLDRRRPFEITDYILPMGSRRPRLGVAVSEEARKAFANQACDDLSRFYQARVAENSLLEASCSSRVSRSMIGIGAATVCMTFSTIRSSIFETAAVLTGPHTGGSSSPSTFGRKRN